MEAAMTGLPDGFILEDDYKRMSSGLPAGFVLDGSPPAQQQEMGRLGAIGQGLKQGVTFGLADELQSGAAAGTVGLANLLGMDTGGLTAGEAYRQAMGDYEMDRQQAAQQHPWLYHPAEIAGAATTGALAARGAGQLSARLGGPTLGGAMKAAPIATASGLGATGGAIYGAGVSDPGDRLKGAAIGGALGAAAPFAVAGVGRAARGAQRMGAGMRARSPEALEQVSAAMRERSADLYRQSREAGAIINRNKGVNISNVVQREMLEGVTPNPRLHGDSLSVLDQFSERMRGGNVGLDELDQYRKLFQDVVTKNMEITGRVNADGLLAQRAIRSIDNMVENLNPIDIVGGDRQAIDLLQAGRREWAKARKFEDVSRLIQKAQGDPRRLKQQFTTFVNNPKNLRGFSAQEVSALKEAARATTPEKILRAVGKFGVDLGSDTRAGRAVLPVGLAGGSYMATGSPLIGVIMATGGTVAEQMQRYLARGKAERVLKQIERR
jgi:hypothetical protein